MEVTNSSIFRLNTITDILRPGNSGSPVLRQDDLVSIGAHVYGGTYNSASVIGKYGNPYLDYLAAFNLTLPNDALNLIPVTGNTAISAPIPSGYGGNTPATMPRTGPVLCEVCKTRKVDASNNESTNQFTLQSKEHRQAQDLQRPQPITRAPTGSQYSAVTSGTLPHGRSSFARGQLSESEEEGFMDCLRKAASIGAPFLGKVLNTALPMALGPIGGPVGALAGFALNAAGKLAESADAESATDGQDLHEGSMERAIMAEAALSTIQSMELHPELEESIFSDMKETVMKALPVIRKAAPHVMGAMMEPALRIALDSLHKHNQKAGAGAESFEGSGPKPFRPTLAYSGAIDQPADRHAEAFLDYLHTAMNQSAQESTMDGESEEAFMDIIKAGIRFAGKGVLTVAQHGLPILVDALANQHGAEAFEADSSSTTSQAFSADALANRALVAEAALQAVMKLPPQQLQEEGFFDFISDAVKTIAPIAMKMAPVVAGAINPTVGKLVGGFLGQESATVGESAPRNRRRLAAPPKLTQRKSLASLRQQSNANGGRSDRMSRFPGAEEQNGYASYRRDRL